MAAAMRTIPQVAKALGVSESTIKRAINDGELSREKGGVFDVRKARAVVEARAARRGGQPMGGGAVASPTLIAIKQEQAEEELALTRTKRMKAQQELAKTAGELVFKSDVTRAWSELLGGLRDRMLALGDKCALRCQGKTVREIAGILREEIEAGLQELADEGVRVNGTMGRKG